MPATPLDKIKIVVTEKHGIRRFLYPLSTHIPWKFDEPLVIVDEEGAIIPCTFMPWTEFDYADETCCWFAISLAPNETKSFTIEVSKAREVVIPDPLHIKQAVEGLVISQERVSYGFDDARRLHSVIYDEIEHLAEPLLVELETDHKHRIDVRSLERNDGLQGCVVDRDVYTIFDLTACKSWIKVSQQPIGTEYKTEMVRFTLPLSVTSPVQTCDFGFGNGPYARLEAGKIDKVSVALNLEDLNQPRYSISSTLAGLDEPRVDYQGSYSSTDDALSHFWFHWNEPTKSLAVAFTNVPKGTASVKADINSDGRIIIEFNVQTKWSEIEGDESVSCAVTYHFLNAIPPIAAATNPASIICKPEVRVVVEP